MSRTFEQGKDDVAELVKHFAINREAYHGATYIVNLKSLEKPRPEPLPFDSVNSTALRRLFRDAFRWMLRCVQRIQ